MSDNTRHCYVCLAKVEAIANPSGWLHCPRCGANIGFDPPPAPEDVTFKGRELPSLRQAYIDFNLGKPYVYEAPALHHKPKDEYVHNIEAYDPTTKSATVTNPKTLMGRQKLSILSVVPPASIICEAEAMHYGAFEAPRKDGKKGYGPYNWRDDPVEMMIYVDACLRHIFAIVDGEEFDPDSGKPHLGHAKACLGIIADAKENGTLIDDRPKVRNRVASSMLACWKKLQSLTGEPT
jgi:hypothetical protein